MDRTHQRKEIKMGWSELFNFSSVGSSNPDLPEIYPFTYRETEFVKVDVENIYSRILTDVLERTQGIPEDKQSLFWDNCIASESSDGLVTMLSKAMVAKTDLFIVYDKALKLIRKADQKEESQIKDDYKKKASSSVGVFITFKNYARTDFMKIYSGLEYCTISSLYKSMQLSKAVQVKVSDLRGSVALIDKDAAVSQGVTIAQSLAKGVDVLLDAKDSIETARPDLTATNSAMDFIAQKRSFYLGLPASYITGLAPKGLGDSGEGDAKSVERGLKNYYFSIIKPVIEEIFGATTSFKSDDFRQLSTSLEALKTFEITGEDLLTKDDKKNIIAKLFGVTL